jgi:hypothetical protein
MVPLCSPGALLGLLLTVLPSGGPTTARAARPTFADLASFFTEWREFQRPKIVDGLPDYGDSAMAERYRRLPDFQQRLAAFDTTGWTIPQQVDYQLIRAEMNGLDFDHRVLRPWARDPAFSVSVFMEQSDQPAREGPVAYGALEFWRYHFPLSPDDALELGTKLRLIPRLLAQARRNLGGNARDLWIMGARSVRQQSRDLDALAATVAGNAVLQTEARAARQATDEFASWLESEIPEKTGPSGVGIENYDWYLRNVQLLPYTWHDQLTLMRHELARALAALALEEHRNQGLPPLEPIASAAEWDRRFDAAVTEYVTFLRDHEILTVRDYMEPALRARRGQFAPGPREFFNEISYRDPIVMRTHDFHWIDLAQAEHEPHPDPIRRGPLLYNIFDTRTEGFATAMEEMAMDAGLLDTHPHGRELIYILVAERAARAIAGLMMHANQFTIEQAVDYASSRTPRDWLRKDGTTVWEEQHLYLEQPGYGTSYLIGKGEIERILAERVRQLGARFTLRGFMDEFTAVGMIPISLVEWELTGRWTRSEAECCTVSGHME